MPEATEISLAGASSATCSIYDETICACGEAPLWHPLRAQLYWVDVTHHKILTRAYEKTKAIQFDEFVTALAWIDENHLLAATETSLTVMNLDTLERTKLCSLEADNADTRSNDGRADPWGGFWISTMAKDAKTDGGKIYRFYKGNLKVVVPSITIANAICFDRVRNRGYFADTASQKVYILSLDGETGAPLNEPLIFKDFSNLNQAIDGAVVDSDGNIWFGVWDGRHVLKVSPEGKILETFGTGADRPTCPAFGGPNFSDLFVTTAAIGLEESFPAVPKQGKTLVFKGIVKGIAEPSFNLPESFQSEC